MAFLTLTLLPPCVQFKRLIGRKYADPEVQEELRTAVFTHEALSDGGIGIKVCGILFFLGGGMTEDGMGEVKVRS